MIKLLKCLSDVINSIIPCLLLFYGHTKYAIMFKRAYVLLTKYIYKSTSFSSVQIIVFCSICGRARILK